MYFIMLFVYIILNIRNVLMSLTSDSSNVKILFFIIIITTIQKKEAEKISNSRDAFLFY